MGVPDSQSPRLQAVKKWGLALNSAVRFSACPLITASGPIARGIKIMSAYHYIAFFTILAIGVTLVIFGMDRIRLDPKAPRLPLLLWSYFNIAAFIMLFATYIMYQQQEGEAVSALVKKNIIIVALYMMKDYYAYQKFMLTVFAPLLSVFLISSTSTVWYYFLRDRKYRRPKKQDK